MLTYVGWISTPRHTIWIGPPRSTKERALADAQVKLASKPTWADQGYVASGEATTVYEKADDALSLSEWPDI